MKVDRTRPTEGPSGARRTGGADASGFALPADQARGAAASAPVANIASIDALMALQFDSGGARRRQTRRATAQLDTLDRLQAALLGAGSDSDIAALALGLREGLQNRETTGDAGLDEVLNDIDVRAAVELAKRSRSGAGRA